MKSFLILSLLSATLVAQDGQPSILSGTLPSESGANSIATQSEIRTPPVDSAKSKSSAPTDLALATPPIPKDGVTPHDDPQDQARSDESGFLQRSNQILAKLLENGRSIDPFGMPMDPANAASAPALAEQYHEEVKSVQLDNSALKNALLSLPITGIYPQKKMLVLGARTFQVGGEFGIKVQDLVIRLRFEGVRNGEIFFQDAETKEMASIPFRTLPAEFEPLRKGASHEAGPGIQRMNDLYIAN